MPDVVRVSRDIAYLPRPNEEQLILSDTPPPVALITSAFALAFEGDRLLMANVRRRGWDIPGGHVEPGEGPEETMRREVLEETGARLGEARLLGYQLQRILGPRPPEYRYPYPDSYQVFYVARLVHLGDPLATGEVDGRALFGPDRARALAWVRANLPLYEAAIGALTSLADVHHAEADPR